jgi:NADPH-dependent 2,4-dienoyl-CoA reductase/sulfur reductase-like enzyme
MRVISSVADLESSYDLVIVGAGPAGMAAATTGSELGLSTLLIDENSGPGGQIYRAIATTTLRTRSLLGEDFWRGAVLLEELDRSDACYAPLSTVWLAGRADGSDLLEVGVSLAGRAQMVFAKQLVFATGAMERPFPIPGWTLPGVMTAGAAQIALKSGSLVPSGRTVIAGCGPLLYLLAVQLNAAGGQVDTFLDTAALHNRRPALRELPDFLASPYLLKGMKLLLKARRGLRIVRGVTSLSAEGDGRLSSVSYASGNGETVHVSADTLLLHQGVVPNVNLSNAAGCRHEWDDVQLAWRPQVDAWFSSTVRGIAIAGDSAGIAGADSAPLRGRLAVIGAAHRLGRCDDENRDQLAAPVQAALKRVERGRRFLDVLYRPARAFRIPTQESTVVCRCEEVTAGRIRQAVTLGALGPNQLKTFLRCGMGPCQGRMCGLTVTEMIADVRGITPPQVGYYRLRPPVKPITVAELATLPKTESAERAVAR